MSCGKWCGIRKEHRWRRGMEQSSFRTEEVEMGDGIGMRTMRRTPGFWLGAALICANGALAQTPDAEGPGDPGNAQPPAATNEQAPVPIGTVIRTESRLVLVDAVVSDKKGHYVTDLRKEDFKVYEDNKEQSIASFSFGSDPALQNASNQKHYLILFFDTSSMEMGDQLQARNAATKFIESNTNPDALMAVVNFGGSLQIRQNFTANGELLKTAVSSVNTPHIETNPQQQTMVATIGMPTISNAESD